MFKDEELNKLTIEFHNKMGKADALNRTLSEWEIELNNFQFLNANDNIKTEAIESLKGQITVLKVNLIRVKESTENQFFNSVESIKRITDKRKDLIRLDFIIEFLFMEFEYLSKLYVRIFTIIQ